MNEVRRDCTTCYLLGSLVVNSVLLLTAKSTHCNWTWTQHFC